jgi:hypothetical protein
MTSKERLQISKEIRRWTTEKNQEENVAGDVLQYAVLIGKTTV